MILMYQVNCDHTRNMRFQFNKFSPIFGSTIDEVQQCQPSITILMDLNC